MKKLINLFICFSICGIFLAQSRPVNGIANSTAKGYAITHVTVFVNPETTLEDATILIENDKIKSIGKDLEIPSGYISLDRTGMYVLPSFIELYSNYGVKDPVSKSQGGSPQIESLNKNDSYWNEAIHPEIDAIDLFEEDKKKSEELLKLGFGFVLSHQMDGIVRGTGTLISIGIREQHESILQTKAASFYSFSKGISQQTYPSSLMGSIALLRQGFYDLQFYNDHKSFAQNSNTFESWKTQSSLPAFFKVDDKWDIFRAEKIQKEFNRQFIFVGSGNEYSVAQELKQASLPIVIPINFPKAYNVADPYIARNIPLSDLKHWEMAPFNFRILAQQQVKMAITSFSCDPSLFWKNIRKMIDLGTNVKDVFNSLTLQPAAFLGMEQTIGSLDIGKLASFSVFTENPFVSESIQMESWQMGQPIEWKKTNDYTILGSYNVALKNLKLELQISGSNEKPIAKLVEFNEIWDKKLRVFKKDSLVYASNFSISNNDITLQFELPQDADKVYLMHGKIMREGSILEGDLTYPDGSWGQWVAIRKQKAKNNPDPNIEKPIVAIPDCWYPSLAYGSTKVSSNQPVVFQNVTIWTNENDGIIERGHVITQNGKITYVGKNKTNYPAGAQIIDGVEFHLTSGIIDEHSHIAISRGVNEGGQSITAEVSIGDVVNPDDISIYRQLSGGVTASQLLHGSANVIGGQSALIKLRWGLSPESMKIENAPKFIKCALGENVKQSNWGDRNTIRFPQSRMGVEQVFYDGFYRALDYKKQWEEFNNCENCSAEKRPRKDLELEVLNEILEGKRFITCHSYVQSEINMLMKVADSMGFKVNTFTHILEGYKVADKMKEHGVGASTFSDWWAYKFEVNDAIPYNAALMHSMGLTVAINSDDAEMGRRLNQEAAKTIKYGGVSEIEAWKMVTLNPAKLLHLDDKMGSVKTGKDADLVLWSTNPLSIEAKVLVTMVDGVIYYSKEKDIELQKNNEKERMRIISKMLDKEVQTEPKQAFIKKRKKNFHCDTLGEEGTETENLH